VLDGVDRARPRLARLVHETLQAQDPPASATTFSLPSRTSTWSMGTSPHSFTSTVTGVMKDAATPLRLLLARPGMRGVVHLGERLKIEMRVHLRTRNRRMTQHLLDGTQIARRL